MEKVFQSTKGFINYKDMAELQSWEVSDQRKYLQLLPGASVFNAFVKSSIWWRDIKWRFYLQKVTLSTGKSHWDRPFTLRELIHYCSAASHSFSKTTDPLGLFKCKKRKDKKETQLESLKLIFPLLRWLGISLKNESIKLSSLPIYT